MDDLATLPYLHQLEILVSPGVDPLTNLCPAGSAELFVEPVTFINLQTFANAKKIYSFAVSYRVVDDDTPLSFG